MINAAMRTYEYYTYGAQDEYGQQTLSKEAQGTIKISINTTTQSVQDNINYKDCSYIGLTMNNAIDDSYVIKYNNELLKVLYVSRVGRYNQAFLKSV